MYPWPHTSMTDSRISGAEEPRAISVRLDTVSFHTRMVVVVVSPLGLLMTISFSWDVMTSMAAMKRSAMMDTPRNM